MEKRNTKKRAFTLAELAVVLAVIAIASTMVVSFTALVGNRRAVSQQKLDAYTEIRLVEALVENYIENNAPEAAMDTDAVLASINIKTTLESVKEIEISAPEVNSGKMLYYCTLTYEVAKSEETYTFCVLKGGSNQ